MRVFSLNIKAVSLHGLNVVNSFVIIKKDRFFVRAEVMYMRILRTAIIPLLVGAIFLATIGLTSVTKTQDPPVIQAEDMESYYLNMGRNYEGTGEFNMALACYRKILSDQPEHWEALYRQTNIHKIQSDPEVVLADYEKLIEIDPSNIDIQSERIIYLCTCGQRELAKHELEELIRQQDCPEYRELYSHMEVAAPVLSIPSGTYDTYQLLEVTCSNKSATIYYSTDGTEPTTTSHVVDDGLVLSYPDYHFKFKAFDALGYESETVEANYIITVPAVEIMRQEFGSIGRSIRHQLSMEYTQPLYNYEAAQVRNLYITGNSFWDPTEAEGILFYDGYYKTGSATYEDMGDPGHVNLTNLQYLPFLKTLAICWQEEVPWEMIQSMAYLEELSLLHNRIDDLSPLAGMTGLKKLALGWNRISDLTPLSGLTGLTSLGLWDNQITDISPLKGMQDLQYLDIANNKVRDLSAVEHCPNLWELWANGNQIQDISRLDPAHTLRILIIGDNPVSDGNAWLETHPDIVRTDMER